MSFSLVKFWENGEIEEGVVPSHWLVDGRVYWSNSLNEFMRHMKEQRPIDLKWPSYEWVKVVFTDGIFYFSRYL